MNLASYIERTVREFPEHVAIRMSDLEVTYAEFDRRARSLACYLRSYGFKQGDKVGIYLPNCPEYLILLYATWILGGVAVPINYRFRQEELQFVLEDAEIHCLAVTAEDIGRLQELLVSLPNLRLLIQGHHQEENALSVIFQKKDGDVSCVPCGDTEDAMLMYTSGTTGRPKGVRQTHRTNAASIEMVVDAWQLTSRDHVLCTAPMFHVGGLQCSTLPTLFTGGTITLLPKWDPADWLAKSRDLKPTWSGLVSTMLVDVVNHVKTNPDQQKPLDSFRLCFFGGSPTPSVISEYFETTLGVPLLEIYGQTELSGIAVTYRVGERRVPGSMGKPMTQVLEAKVVEPGGGKTILPGDEGAGVFYLKGDTVTPGYWKREELNQERIRGGWIETGDIVRWDVNGYLHYTDRLDDMIITGGENVYPKEVESVLAEHLGIAEVAVIGTAHERWIEQVTAIIVPRNPSLTVEDIISFCEQHPGLAGYKRPRRIEFVQELPKTGSGKLNKSLLKQMYRAK